jgi:hypothetical protein
MPAREDGGTVALEVTRTVLLDPAADHLLTLPRFLNRQLRKLRTLSVASALSRRTLLPHPGPIAS